MVVLRSLLAAGVIACGELMAGCAFLPGFGLFESPMLYYIPVAQVAERVTCEVRAFVDAHHADPAYSHHKWALAEEDIKVVLTLTSDEQGYVNFTGIDPKQLGFNSLQSLITTTTTNGVKIPTLNAKMTGKRSKVVTTTFSVSAKPILREVGSKARKQSRLGTPQLNCDDFRVENPLNSFYLKDYLNNYFETINYDRSRPEYKDESLTDAVLHKLRPLAGPPQIPSQLKIQSVQLATSFQLLADIGAGATPTLLGNGSVFIVPINGLGLGYSPDYAHKVDMTMNICDQTEPSCNPDSPTAARFRIDKGIKGSEPIPISFLREQCHFYGVLSPLLSVKPPKDYERADGAHMRCNKLGQYREVLDYRPVPPVERPVLEGN
jgi:hypothetical protein